MTEDLCREARFVMPCIVFSRGSFYTSIKAELWLPLGSAKGAETQLGRHIEDEVTRLLLPPAIASCAGGAEMTWDGLQVSSSLLSVDGGHRSLSLDEVELVTLDEEHLAIFHKGQQRAWHKQRVETIANVAVFKGLLDHLLQQHVRSQLPQVIATYHAETPIALAASRSPSRAWRWIRGKSGSCGTKSPPSRSRKSRWTSRAAEIESGVGSNSPAEWFPMRLCSKN